MGGGGLDLVIVGNFEHKFKIGQLERLSLLCSLYLNLIANNLIGYLIWWAQNVLLHKCLIIANNLCLIGWALGWKSERQKIRRGSMLSESLKKTC